MRDEEEGRTRARTRNNGASGRFTSRCVASMGKRENDKTGNFRSAAWANLFDFASRFVTSLVPLRCLLVLAFAGGDLLVFVFHVRLHVIRVDNALQIIDGKQQHPEVLAVDHLVWIVDNPIIRRPAISSSGIRALLPIQPRRENLDQ